MRRSPLLRMSLPTLNRLRHRRRLRLIMLRQAMRSPAAQTSNAPATPIPSAPIPSAPAAPARPARAASDEDYVSEDDEKVENSTFIGLRAIEKIIGGTVIDERPLHQP